MYKTLEEKILCQSTAVRTIVLPEVKKVIDTVIPDADSVKNYTTYIAEWLRPVIDLTDFHVYPMNGITEGLNWWVGNCQNNICKEAGDYQWVDDVYNKMQPAIMYQSIPSAIDGNYRDINTENIVALDLAYIGSTKIKKIDIPKNVEYVFYSFSKPFGIRNIRTGWYFTRKPDKKLDELVYGAKYYNYYASSVAEKIILNFDIDYVYQQLSNVQESICKKLNLNASDSVWLATTTNETYAKFRRKNNIARLCLSGVYEIC